MSLIFFILFLLAIAGLTLHYLAFSASSQFFGKVICGTKPKEKILALTFDDGPQEIYTLKIVDLLEKYGINGTFFQVGKNIEQNPELARRIFEEGHIIGNHSYNHCFSRLLKTSLFDEEIRKTQEIIYKTIGKKPKFFRPPWLFKTPRMFKVLQKYNLITVTGTFAILLESCQPNPSIMALETLKKVRPGNILIFHDGHGSLGAKREATIKTLEIVIPELLNKGYRFSSLSELLGIDPYQ